MTGLPLAHGVAVLAALAARAIEVGATREEARAVLARHVGRTIEVSVAAKRAHASAAVTALAAEASETIDIRPAHTADAPGARGRVEATARARIGIGVIVATASGAERAHDDEPHLERNATDS